MKRGVLVIARYYTRCLLALFRKSHELEIFTSCSTSPSDWWSGLSLGIHTFLSFSFPLSRFASIPLKRSLFSEFIIWYTRSSLSKYINSKLYFESRRYSFSLFLSPFFQRKRSRCSRLRKRKKRIPWWKLRWTNTLLRHVFRAYEHVG